MDLAGFLAARLDEDERYIRALQAAGERFRDNATPAQFSRDTPVVRELFDEILDDPEAVAAITAVQDAGPPNDLERLLREAAAKRALIAEIQAIRHFYVDEDTWFSCSQATDPTEPDGEPGSGCADDDRRGKPCDCGRDTKVTRQLGILAAIYSGHPDYQQEWKP
jgi:uncharacterized protein DUF6221